MKNIGKYLPVFLAILGGVLLYFFVQNENKKQAKYYELAKKEINRILLEFYRLGKKYPTLEAKINEGIAEGRTPEDVLIREAVNIAANIERGTVEGVQIPYYVWMDLAQKTTYIL